MRGSRVSGVVISLAVFLYGTSSGAYEGCDDGIVVGDTCYIYRDSPKTWNDADLDCAEMGGYMVEPRNASVTSTVESIMATQPGASLWIGAQQEGSQPEGRTWRWTSECPDCGKGASGCYHGAFDLVFVIDESGSIRDDNFDSSLEDTPSDNWWQIKQFVKKLADVFNIGLVETLVATVSFANAARVQFTLTDHFTKAELLHAIETLDYLGQNTNTSSGLRSMRELVLTPSGGDRTGVPNIAVVITDGRSTYSANETIPQAELAHAAGIKTYVVGITDEVNQTELTLMASPPRVRGENWWHVPGFSQLNSYGQVNLIAEQICRDMAGSPKQWLYGTHRPIEPQGCYDAGRTATTWTEVDVGSNLTPESCMERCSSYAAVSDGNKCSCADEFDYEGPTSGCVEPCPGDAGVACGGVDRTFVYKLRGEYGGWGYSEPNNLRGRQNCAALSGFSYSRTDDDPDNTYAFIDEECVLNRGFICDIPFSSCVEAPGYMAADGWCYYLSAEPTSWFQARGECKARSGDLALIEDAADHQRYRSVLQASGMGTSAAVFWIGLARNRFVWTSGDYVSTYTAFVPGEPDTAQTGCLALERTGTTSFFWREDGCDARKAFICQIDPVNLREVPAVVTSSTTTMTTTATGAQSSGSDNGGSVTPGAAPPSAGASAAAGEGGGGLSGLSIALLVMAVILLLIIVIGVIACCVITKKASVSPVPEKMYDARIYAPYPERYGHGPGDEDSFVNGYSAKMAEAELVGLHSPVSSRSRDIHHMSTLNVASLPHQYTRRSGGFGGNYYKI